MGIRFLCHHCEKRLNVKSTQAGNEGLCPFCNGAIQVPNKSTIPSLVDIEKHKARNARHVAALQDKKPIGLHAADEQITMDGIPAEELQSSEKPTKVSKNAPPADSDPTRFKAETFTTVDEDADDSVELFMLDKPKPSESYGEVDRIAEKPKSVWYFRSHELGEKGPLKSKIMREHLDNGDIKIGCVVWRQDWDDWMPAEVVFPSIKDGSERVPTKPKEVRVARPSPPRRARQPMAKKNKIFLACVAAGLVLIFVLSLILVQIVSK